MGRTMVEAAGISALVGQSVESTKEKNKKVLLCTLGLSKVFFFLRWTAFLNPITMNDQVNHQQENTSAGADGEVQYLTDLAVAV